MNYKPISEYNAFNARWNNKMPAVHKPVARRRVMIRPWTLFKGVVAGTMALLAKEYIQQGAGRPNVYTSYPYPGRGNVGAQSQLAVRSHYPQQIEVVHGNFFGKPTNLPVMYKHWPQYFRNWKKIPAGVNITGRLPTTKVDDAVICAAGSWFYKATGWGGKFVGTQCGFTFARVMGLLKFLDNSVFQASFVVLGAYVLASRSAKKLADDEKVWRDEELAKMNARIATLRHRATNAKTNANKNQILGEIAKLGREIATMRKGDAKRRRNRLRLNKAVTVAEKEARRLAAAVTKGEVVVVPNEDGGIRAVPVAARNSQQQANSIYNAFNNTPKSPNKASPLVPAASAPARGANRASPTLRRASSVPIRRASNVRRNALRAVANL